MSGLWSLQCTIALLCAGKLNWELKGIFQKLSPSNTIPFGDSGRVCAHTHVLNYGYDSFQPWHWMSLWKIIQTVQYSFHVFYSVNHPFLCDAVLYPASASVVILSGWMVSPPPDWWSCLQEAPCPLPFRSSHITCWSSGSIWACGMTGALGT